MSRPHWFRLRWLVCTGLSLLLPVLAGERVISAAARAESADDPDSDGAPAAVQANPSPQEPGPSSGARLTRLASVAAPEPAAASGQVCGAGAVAPAVLTAAEATLPAAWDRAAGLSESPVPGAGPASTLFLETFEGVFPSGLWTRSGNPTWDDTTYKSYSGVRSAWCAAGGTAARNPAVDNYADDMNAWMVYGPFSLSGVSGGVFSFHYWLESETDFDFLQFFVSTNGVNFYGYETTGSTLNSWVETAINLTSVPTLGNISGQPQVWIAIVFVSDFSVNYKGAFVDDVRVDNVTTPDLVAQQVYFRDQPGGAGNVVSNPLPGQSVYPHFFYRLDGPGSVSGTIWAMDVDGSVLCQTAPGSLLPGSYFGWCTSAYVVPSGAHQLRGRVDPAGTIVEANELNNEAVVPFGSGPTLDLVAQQVYFRDQPDNQGNIVDNPCVGESVYPHFAFDVTGSGSATGKIFTLEIDSTPVCSLIGTLDAGFSYVGNCTSPWVVTAGDHTLVGVLDPDGTIVETSEVNNQVAHNTTNCLLPDIRVNPSSVTVACPESLAAESVVASAAAVADHKLRHKQDILGQFDGGQAMARVIVTLRPPPNAPAVVDLSDARSARRHRDAIRPHLQALLGRLAPADFRLRYPFENQPCAWMEVTRAGLARLQNDPAVELIEPVRDIPMNLAQGLPLMDAMTYRLTYGGAGVSVAICDSGVDYTHPRLGGGGFPNAKVIGGFDTGDNDANPFPNGEAHGTACAGIAAGNTGTVGDYIGGVAPDARIYALKVTPASNPGSASDASIAAAWDWCVTHRNDDPANPILVISTSFGGGRFFSSCDAQSAAITSAAGNAVAAGITLLVSSGNDGYCDSIAFPGCVSHVISVGAVYDADFGDYSPCINAASCVTKFATGGCTTGFYTTDSTAADLVTSYSNSAGFLAVLAPANQAYTADIVGAGGYNAGDYTPSFGGTSAACPYAAGGVAALQSAAKAQTGSFLSPAQVRQLLIQTGDSIVDPKNGLAKPRVNLANAIDSIIPPNPECVTIFNDGSVALHVTSVTAPPWATLVPPPPYTFLAGASQTVCVQACGSCAGVDLDGVLVINSDDPDEPAVNVPVHVDCPAQPASVNAWRSVRTHGAAPLGLALSATAAGNGIAGPTVESRSGGIRRIEVDFSGPVVLVNTAGITVIGQTTTGSTLGGPVPYVPASVSLADADTLQILFNPGALPDKTCYTITLPEDLVAATLAGDRTVLVRSLYGDATGSGVITLSDAIAIKRRIGAGVAANPQFDVDLSNAITAADALAAKARVASPAPHKALCP